MKTVPSWTDRTPRPDGIATEEPPPTADVVIIGAGVTGLTAARRLADLGRSVVLVEAMEIGQGASAVNGGQLNYGLKPSNATLTKRFGPETARAMWDASLDAIDLAQRITIEDGFDADFRRSGAVSLGYRKDGVKSARAESREMKEDFGFETTVAEGEELRSFIGSDAFAYGVISTVDAAVDPAKYTFGLAEGVARRGVAIVENCRVAGLYRSASTHFVATTKGTIQAGDVLIATNGYTPKDLVPDVRRQVVPIGSYMVATVPLAPDVLDRLLPGNYIYWTQRRFLNYFRRSEDNRLLFGGRPDLSPNLELVSVAQGMQTTIGELFPELAEVELSHVWGGRLAATFDLLPHLGRTADGVWYLVGYGGHGMTLATYLGTEVGGLIGGAIEDSPFLGLPHPTRFYYRGNPWFLRAGGVLFRGLDRVGR
ncbi:MAG: FAD-binding oxidoreductase [Acidimicrobiia bacterium]